ncbi:hypothetical protein U1Q18_047612 [Sarracenia purpurea var. burkii]
MCSSKEAAPKLALFIAIATAKFLVRVIVGPAAKGADAWFCYHGRKYSTATGVSHSAHALVCHNALAGAPVPIEEVAVKRRSLPSGLVGTMARYCLVLELLLLAGFGIALAGADITPTGFGIALDGIAFYRWSVRLSSWVCWLYHVFLGAV